MDKIKNLIFKTLKINHKNYNLLIDLPIDIFMGSIIPILFVMLLYHKEIYAYYRKPISQKIKAKQDCDTFAQAIQKHNILEGTIVKDKYFKEIRGKYIQGLDTYKDPWGKRYMQDTTKHIVYSAGPDGVEGTNDDIIVNY